MSILLNGGCQYQKDWTCNCGSPNAWKPVHAAGCPAMDCNLIPCEDNKPATSPILVGPNGKPIMSKARNRHKKPRKGRISAETPDYRFVLQFYFSRPINIRLWKQIKAPPGWRKCPTTESAQRTYRGVRFQCDNLTQPLAPDAVQELRAMLCLSLEEIF